jgi:thymidine kinase
MREGMPTRRGRVEVVTGPMFAGKTEELLRRVRRAQVAGQRVQVFTHRLDTRSGTDRVASHAGLDHPSLVAASADDVWRAVRPDTAMVAVDEAHFFGADLPEMADRLARDGVVVVVAGLDVTFAGLPFEPLPSLMALAERVDKLTAICTLCGADAIFHARVAPTHAAATEVVAEHVGGEEKYQARCRHHFHQ